MIILAVTLPIRPESRQEAVQAALRMTEETHKEAGCIRYMFLSPLDDPNTLFVYEEWRDQDALDLHNASPHMKVFQAALAGALTGEVKVDKYAVR